MDAEDLEEARRHVLGRDAPGLRLRHQVHLRGNVEGDPVDRAYLLLVQEKEAVRHGKLVASFAPQVLQGHQSVGVLEGQGARVVTAITVNVGYRSRLRTAKRASLNSPVIVIVSFLSQRASITQLRTRTRSLKASRRLRDPSPRRRHA
jgi:hypothetical protein